MVKACSSRYWVSWLLLCLAATLGVSSSAAQTWVELFPAGGPSEPIVARLWTGSGYDAVNNRLIVYFQINPSMFPNLFPEVWVLTNANGVGGTPVWTQLNPAGSAPTNVSALAGVVYDSANNRLIVYGGCFAGCSPAQSTVYVLTHANGLGGTPTWSQSSVTNPQERADHSVVYDAANNFLIAFGGHLAFPGTDQNDTRILSNANGLASPSTWTSLSTTGGPPDARASPRAIYDAANNRMTTFAGAGNVPPIITLFNDVWVLTDANGLSGTPTWTQLLPSGTPPAPRQFNSSVKDSTNNRMIMFGGIGGSNAQSAAPLGDLWQLSHANGLGGTPSWMQLFPSGTPPGPNYLHAAAFDVANQRMIVFGGADHSGTPHKRVWVLIFNQAPAADAGADQTVECTSLAGTSVMLDGSGSTDHDAGQTLSYTWTGPFPEGGGTVTGVNPTVSLPLGTHTITLTVDDGSGGTDTDTVQVSVVLHVEGLLAPLAALVPEGHLVPLPARAFKAGSTLPLKLQMFCGATPLTDADVAAPRILALARQGDAVDIPLTDPDSGEANDTGVLFRYSDGNWVYNLSTKTLGLTAGTYTVTIELPDGQRYTAGFVLK